MLKKISGIYVMLLGNLIPFLHCIALVMVWFQELSTPFKLALFLVILYVVPPVFSRILFIRTGPPEGQFKMDDPEFKLWWLSTQLQALFLRFEFLEESLRVIPLFYSSWLRLWGSKIGRRVYWSPQVKILDRSHLNIEDNVVVGFATAFTSHHFNQLLHGSELILARSFVGQGAILGGLSGVGPGARVAPGEMLPSTMLLAPFYEWRDGRRRNLKIKDAELP